METLLAAGQAYIQEISLGIQVILLVLFCIMAHKITVTKQKIDMITKTVEEYFAAVMEEETTESITAVDAENPKENASILKQQQEEEQNRLISSVLQEIFP